jgi:hypothetical protein
MIGITTLLRKGDSDEAAKTTILGLLCPVVGRVRQGRQRLKNLLLADHLFRERLRSRPYPALIQCLVSRGS